MRLASGVSISADRFVQSPVRLISLSIKYEDTRNEFNDEVFTMSDEYGTDRRECWREMTDLWLALEQEIQCVIDKHTEKQKKYCDDKKMLAYVALTDKRTEKHQREGNMSPVVKPQPDKTDTQSTHSRVRTITPSESASTRETNDLQTMLQRMRSTNRSSDSKRAKSRHRSSSRRSARRAAEYMAMT